MGKSIEAIRQYLKENKSDDDIYTKLSRMNISTQDKVMYCLWLNGWKNKARNAGTKVLQDFEIFEYYVFPVARKFLTQFAGLTINGTRNPVWQNGIPKEQQYKYQVNITKEVDITDIAISEALQIKKDELLIPIAWEDRFWVMPTLYLSETGKVYYSYEGNIGIEANNLCSYFAQVFGFEPKLRSEDKKEEVFADYEQISQIEDDLNQGNYISYAQKRFSRNGGVPNPLTADDDFTKTFLATTD